MLTVLFWGRREKKERIARKKVFWESNWKTQYKMHSVSMKMYICSCFRHLLVFLLFLSIIARYYPISVLKSVKYGLMYSGFSLDAWAWYSVTDSFIHQKVIKHPLSWAMKNFIQIKFKNLGEMDIFPEKPSLT